MPGGPRHTLGLSRPEAGSVEYTVVWCPTTFSYRIPRRADPRGPAMASPAAEAGAGEVAAPEPVEGKGKEEKRKRGGLLGRIWRGLFGGRDREDYEKRLQYLSKEEATVHARMRRRTQFSRRAVRNLIVLSVLSEHKFWLNMKQIWRKVFNTLRSWVQLFQDTKL